MSKQNHISINNIFEKLTLNDIGTILKGYYLPMTSLSRSTLVGSTIKTCQHYLFFTGAAF